MKIKGKEIKNYSNEHTCLVTKETLLDLEQDFKESLDNLVLALQTWALKEAQRTDHMTINWPEKEESYNRARAYLDAVREINNTFETNYSQSIDNVKKHFEIKTPAKDN